MVTIVYQTELNQTLFKTCPSSDKLNVVRQLLNDGHYIIGER